MYNNSPNSPLYGLDDVLSAVQTVTEASNKLEDDILSFLYVNGKTDPSVLAGTFDMSEREMQRLLKSLEMRGLVKATVTMAIPTPEGRNYALKKNPTLKSVRYDSYEPEGQELDEMTKTDKKTIDAFYDKKEDDKSFMVNSTGKVLKKVGFAGAQDIAKWENGKVKIVAVNDDRQTQEVIAYIRKTFPKNIVVESTELDEMTRKSPATKKMEDKIETMLYVIMAEGDHARGEKPYMTKGDLERELVNKGITYREVAPMLAKAEKIGLIKDDGAVYELTDMALRFISKREE